MPCTYCHGQFSNLSECRYCHEPFCSEHIAPTAHMCTQFQRPEGSGVPVSAKSVGRSSWISQKFPNFRRRILGVLSSLWIALIVIGVLLGGTFAWFPVYFWVAPGTVAFTIGSFGASRIWRYAHTAHNALGAWTRRIVMAVGLLLTGLILLILYVGASISISFLHSLLFSGNQSAVNAAANTSSGLIMNLAAFIIPFFLAFVMGEVYLYRNRHRYTFSWS